MYSMCSENVTIFSGSPVNRGIRVIDDSVQVAWKCTFASSIECSKRVSLYYFLLYYFQHQLKFSTNSRRY